MEVIETLNKNNEIFPPTTIALGYFDGVHLGHQELINTTRNIALKNNTKSAVLTFKKHPLSILSPDKSPKLLFSNKKKISIFESMGIDYFVYPDFTREIMNQEPEVFIKDVLVDNFNVKHVIVGFNYTFGSRGSGNSDTLKKLGKTYGFKVTTIDPVKVDNKIVSSTLIRKLIEDGQMDNAKKYLGRSYSIIGQVIHGKGLGKKIDIPTANIKTDDTIIIPKRGVYHTNIFYKGVKYDALTNVGFNPTFKNHPFTIESHILNFNKDIYDEEVEIYFLKRIRSEMKFDSLESLVFQVEKDILFIKEKQLIS